MSVTAQAPPNESQAIHDGETVWVSVKRVCEALGIAEQRQAEKLKGKAWACTTMMVAHDTTGRKQDAFCISLKSLPMWLGTIEASRVAKSAVDQPQPSWLQLRR